MRSMRVLAASLWILCPLVGAAQERQRPVAGSVTDVDAAAHTLSQPPSPQPKSTTLRTGTAAVSLGTIRCAERTANDARKL